MSSINAYSLSTESDTDSMPSDTESLLDDTQFLLHLEAIANDIGLEPVTSRPRLARTSLWLPRGILSNIISYACYDWQELRRQHRAIWSQIRVIRFTNRYREISLVAYPSVEPVEIDLGREALYYVPWYDAPNRWWVIPQFPVNLLIYATDSEDEEYEALLQARARVGVRGPIPADVDPASFVHIVADPPTDESGDEDEASQWQEGDD